MGFLKSLMIRVGADTSGVDKELKKASRQLIATGKEWEKVGAGMTKAVTLPILAVGAAAIKMGLDAKETEEKFTYAFGSMSDSVREWSDSLAKARGLDAFDLRNTASDMQTLAKGFGFTNTAASEMAKGLAEAAYAMAEIYEVDAATMADNFSSAFKGRANALNDYGIVIDDTSTKAYAYSKGIAAMGKELTTAQKAQAMYGLIMEAAADEMKEFARTGSDLATTLKNKVNTAFKEFGVALVETGTFDKLVDVLTRVLDKALELATAFGKLPAKTQDVILGATLVVAAFGPVVSGIGNLITWFGKLGIAASGSAGTVVGAFTLAAGTIAAAATVAKIHYDETMALMAGIEDSTQAAGQYATPVPGAPTPAPDYMTGTGLGWGGNTPRNAGGSPYRDGQGDRARDAGGAYLWWTGKGSKNPTLNPDTSQKPGGTTPPETETIPDWLADYYKMQEEQERLFKKQEAAAKAAAALDAFRGSVKSLAQAMLDAGRQFANFIGMFDKVERENVSGNRLAKRMEGQLRAMQDWVSAMGSLKGKVSDSLYRELLNMGPGAVDQIKALVNNSDALSRYEAAYNERNRLASGMGDQAAGLNYKADQVIEKQINNITVTGTDPEKVAELVVKKLRLAGVY